MFEKGSLVMYENNGVCRVEDIMTMPSANGEEKLYYCFSQVGQKGSRLFCPVDNDKVAMRPILTKEEAMHLIDIMPEIELLVVPDERQRKETYRQAIANCNCEGWVSVIKTLSRRERIRKESGKKITVVDRQYLNLAKEYLYGELSVVFDVSVEEIESYLGPKLQGSTDNEQS